MEKLKILQNIKVLTTFVGLTTYKNFYSKFMKFVGKREMAIGIEKVFDKIFCFPFSVHQLLAISYF